MLYDESECYRQSIIQILDNLKTEVMQWQFQTHRVPGIAPQSMAHDLVAYANFAPVINLHQLVLKNTTFNPRQMLSFQFLLERLCQLVTSMQAREQNENKSNIDAYQHLLANKS